MYTNLGCAAELLIEVFPQVHHALQSRPVH